MGQIGYISQVKLDEREAWKNRKRHDRERRKRNKKSVRLEVPINELLDVPDDKSRYRQLSLNEKLDLGNKLADLLWHAEHQLERWEILNARLLASPDELQWGGVRISGPALEKAKEVHRSLRVFSIVCWGMLDWGSSITDASCIFPEKDYVSPLRLLFGDDVLPTMRAKNEENRKLLELPPEELAERRRQWLAGNDPEGTA